MGDYPAYTVAEITRLIRSTLESQFISVRVEGEVSNLNYHRSGHIYFSLKDEYALLNCVIWRGNRLSLRFRLEEGMFVRAQGDITVYEKGGKYQLNVTQISPAGKGPLLLRFLALKEELEKKGYFDAEKKKPLPPFPSRIGVVTSPTGAAVRDIINIIHRRNPHIDIVLFPAIVQGEGAIASVTEGISLFNQIKNVDLIIVGRGGGSIEDLWAFNEREVAEAIYNSDLPVISAVGHETDFTISDFVADLRAPTPSAAAELATPDLSEVINALEEYKNRMQRAVQGKFQSLSEKLAFLSSRPCFRKPEGMFQHRWQQLDYLSLQANSLIRTIYKKHASRLDVLKGKLHSASPLNVLKRGFSIVKKEDTGEIIRDIRQLELGEVTFTTAAEGAYRSKVIEIPEKQRD